MPRYTLKPGWAIVTHVVAITAIAAIVTLDGTMLVEQNCLS